ncbi:MAG: hypothetical protein HY073_03565 [Deltaproteobacteria bacterium]|nr:hypothetical protein [Deltaproteobacteria bacterium]
MEGQTAAPNLAGIATTIRDLVLHCQQRCAALGVSLFIVNNSLAIGGQAYEAAEAAMVFNAPGAMVQTPAGSSSLTGARMQVVTEGPVTIEALASLAREKYPLAERSLAGPDILTANAEVFAIVPNVAGGLSWFESMRRIIGRNVLRDELPPFMETEDEGGRDDPAWLQVSDGQYRTSRDHREAWRFLFDQDLPILRLWEGARHEAAELRSRVFIGRIGGESWMIIVSPGSLLTEESRFIARAVFWASAHRLRVLVTGTFSGFEANPRSMLGRQLENGALIGKAFAEYEGPDAVIYTVGNMPGGNAVVFSESIQPDGIRQFAAPRTNLLVVGGEGAIKAVHAGKLEAAFAVHKGPLEKQWVALRARDPQKAGTWEAFQAEAKKKLAADMIAAINAATTSEISFPTSPRRSTTCSWT